MYLKIVLPFKPLSKNKLKMPIKVGNRVRLSKTPEARRYEREVMDVCEIYKEEINDFMDGYDRVMCIHARYTLEVPYNVFWTRSGHISKRSMDVTNPTEAAQDIVTKFIGFDDAQIVEVKELKVPSDEWALKMEYWLKPHFYLRADYSHMEVE